MNERLNNLISYSRQVSNGFRHIKTLRFSSLRKAFSLMDKREKITLVLLLIAALLSFSWGFRNFYYRHTVIAPDQGGILREGLTGQPTYINPLLAHQDPDLSLIELVYSGLYKYDNSGEIIPGLAESMPQISEDQKQYTIKLKKNVKWHNNKNFTADDVVFTIQTIKDANFKSPQRNLWLSTSVEKLSDFEIKFTTADISGPFIYNLTLPIAPRSVWANIQPQNFLLSQYNLEAIGSGPYAIKQIKKLQSGKVQSITLESFPNYFGGKPNINTIIFNFYDTDEDLLNAYRGRDISSLGFTSFNSNIELGSKRDDAQIINMPLPWYQTALFNLNNPIFSDIKVRQALSMAIDKQKIINDVFKGQALMPSSPLLFNWQTQGLRDISQADVKGAESLLDSAGWTVDPNTNIRTKKGTQLAFTISTNDSQNNVKDAGNLAQQWRELKINVNLNILPTMDLTEKNIRPRNFDILLLTQKFNADPDPFVFWHSSQVKDPGYNLTGFNSPDGDRLITEARTTTDQKSRAQKYEEFNRLVMEYYPIILLDQAKYTYAVSSEIKNISLQTIFSPEQRLQDISNWYIDEKRVWK